MGGGTMPAKTKTAKRAGVKKKAARKKPARRASARPVRKLPETLRLRSISPSLTVNDLQASLSWYRDILGFTAGERWEHDGKLAGIEILAGSVSFYLSQDDWKKGRDRVKGEGFRLHCTTAQKVDKLAEEIRKRGGRLLEEPHDEPWGERAFAVVDPDGFKITISGA
jgi:lactoylglutathione lyase